MHQVVSRGGPKPISCKMGVGLGADFIYAYRPAERRPYLTWAAEDFLIRSTQTRRNTLNQKKKLKKDSDD
jgi:hypothetical protein